MRTLPQDFRTESSGDQNQPLELIDIYLDTADYYFVANNPENISFFNAISGDANTYVAAPITRAPSQVSTGLDVDRIRVGLANVDKTLIGYLQAREWRGRRIVVRQVYANMLSSSGDAVTIFDGLMDVPQVDQEWLSVTALSRISSLKRKAPGRWYQLPCNYRFGSVECGIDATDPAYEKAKTCGVGCSDTRLSGDTIVEAARYWRRGYVIFTSGENSGARQTIKGSGTNYIELDNPLPYTPAEGDTYTVKSGCDKTLYMCSGDYSNEDNFGGFHTIPQNMVIR